MLNNKDGSRIVLFYTPTEDGDFVKYTKVTYDPYLEIIKVYKIDQLKNIEVMEIMKQGLIINLNENK